jgi:hypothetical protein
MNFVMCKNNVCSNSNANLISMKNPSLDLTCGLIIRFIT